MKSISMIKADAREQLLGKYSTVVMAYAIIQFIISACLSPAESQLSFQKPLSIFIYLAVYVILFLLQAAAGVGQNVLYLHIARGQQYSLKDLLVGFQFCADKAILIRLRLLIRMLAYGIPFYLSAAVCYLSFHVFSCILSVLAFLLWMVLCILTKILFSQTLFLVSDRSDLSPSELIKLSCYLMKGHMRNYFCMILSFAGMYLLILLTFGIAAFWVQPYISATMTNYYIQLYETKIGSESKNSTFSALA